MSRVPPDNDNKSAMAYAAGLSHMTCRGCGYKGTILDWLIPFGEDGKPLAEPLACPNCFCTDDCLENDATTEPVA
jgi:hypothetical protein